jgi:hypothetical protein
MRGHTSMASTWSPPFCFLNFFCFVLPPFFRCFDRSSHGRRPFHVFPQRRCSKLSSKAVPTAAMTFLRSLPQQHLHHRRRRTPPTQPWALVSSNSGSGLATVPSWIMAMSVLCCTRWAWRWGSGSFRWSRRAWKLVPRRIKKIKKKEKRNPFSRLTGMQLPSSQ